MTLSDLGSLGEFISSIAVVLSLIYVGVQIRLNAKETRLASVQRVLEASRDTILKLASEDFIALGIKARDNPEGLTPIEKSQHYLITAAQLRNVEIAFLMHAEGVLDDETFAVFEARVRTIINTYPGIIEATNNTKRFQEWFKKIRDEESGT